MANKKSSSEESISKMGKGSHGTQSVPQELQSNPNAKTPTGKPLDPSVWQNPNQAAFEKAFQKTDPRK